MRNKFLFIILILFITASTAVYLIIQNNNAKKTISQPPTLITDINTTPVPTNSNTPIAATILVEPIGNALSRVIKKSFGIYVSPNNSAVSPEKFTGYHTGVDFEILSVEQNNDVIIYAVCAGPLILKKYAAGYGGVAVQQCDLSIGKVSIIYGHLRLSSINAIINDQFKAGEQIGVLGTGYSTETDGERKHLHLSIHKGASINLLGYVQKPEELSQWLDALTLLK